MDIEGKTYATKFQFQSGSIKTRSCWNYRDYRIPFQFQSGSIKT